MNKYRIIGGCTTIEYRSLIVEANSEEEAINTVNAGLDEDTFSYLDWELDDVKELNDFETIEVIQLS